LITLHADTEVEKEQYMERRKELTGSMRLTFLLHPQLI